MTNEEKEAKEVKVEEAVKDTKAPEPSKEELCARELAVLLAEHKMELFISPMQIQLRPRAKKEETK